MLQVTRKAVQMMKLTSDSWYTSSAPKTSAAASAFILEPFQVASCAAAPSLSSSHHSQRGVHPQGVTLLAVAKSATYLAGAGTARCAPCGREKLMRPAGAGTPASLSLEGTG